MIGLKRHFKGHMKISASMLYHRSHYPDCQYQHSISNGIGSAKISFFSYKFFSQKNRTSIFDASQ